MENNSDTEMELYEELVGDVSCRTPKNSRDIGLQSFQTTRFRKTHCRM